MNEQDNSELFASIFHHCSDAIMAANLDGIITRWNKAAEDIFGYTEEEISGKHTSILVTRDRLVDEQNILETVKAGQRCLPYETNFLAKDGTSVSVSVSASAIADSRGTIIGVARIARPIPMQESQDDALQRSYKKIADYRYALDESSIVAITNTRGVITYVNDNFCKISKFSREELIGQDHRIVNSGTHDAAFIRDLWVTIANGKIWKGEIRNKAKDGSYYWVATTIVPFLDDKCKPYKYVAIRSDITERKVKAEQIDNLLEHINDGFIALDENLCYTYANRQIGLMVGIAPELMIGRYIWDVFGDAIGSSTYHAIQKALTEGIYVTNEDFYAPLNLWQENRIYPAEKGLSIFIRDITNKRREDEHLRLMESVITNTIDAVLITEATPLDGVGPRILYVNEAFTRMTGYSSADVVGKTPRILQGPKSDTRELSRLKEALKKQEPCEITVVNYKKNGEEFWVNFSVNPAVDENGCCTHFVAIERDVTKRKNEELEGTLLAEISQIFNVQTGLNDILNNTLHHLVNYGDFTFAEFWLIGSDRKKISIAARFASSHEMSAVFDVNAEMMNVSSGVGLAGITWSTQNIENWDVAAKERDFPRRPFAEKAGIKQIFGLPLCDNNKIIGVLLLGLNRKEPDDQRFKSLFEHLCTHLGAEIMRKQLEQELNQIFTLTPDIICIAGTNGYLKKINPGMSLLLEYSEEELLTTPFISFVLPEDQQITDAEVESIKMGNVTTYFENRWVTKSGKIKWLAWTATAIPEEGRIFCVAKNITDKKELEALLSKATALARIGGWEIDIVKGTVYWSAMTKEIHEVAHDFIPDPESASIFVQDGADRDLITRLITDTVTNGTAFDVEVQIVTGKGRVKWVRVIGEAEFAADICTKVYGSFQDIDDRKTAEVAVTQILEERNTILESIADAFFAVDNNWVVTYWNSMAEKVFRQPKEKMVGRVLWNEIPESSISDSYDKYRAAMESNRPMHFEDYYPLINRWYEISAYPSVKGLSVYLKDITERKTSEIRLGDLNRDLARQSKELAISNAELEQFAYVASHDLQEPLRMVTSFLTQLEKKYGDIIDERGKKYMFFAVDGAKRMRQIILDLLEFSRVGRTDRWIEDVDTATIIEDILILFRRQIEETSADVVFAGMPVLHTFKSPLRQVFQNLISNSLKYQEYGKKPVISVSCMETRHQWEFLVTDNGIGIKKEYFDKIFIIFQRLHNKDEYSGTGMGLAVTKKIIESMGGKIWLTSDEGTGSTFHFTILKNE